MASTRVTVVVATRDRARRLGEALDRLLALPEAPPVVVVDDASTDATPEVLRARACDRLTALGTRRSLGAVARNLGVRQAVTPYVAFCDDDSAWEPGALTRAADLFDASPCTGALAGSVLVGPDRRPDPLDAVLARSPLPDAPGASGPTVLGFLACAAVVRVEAFRRAGGFSPVLGFGGEERLLALDLAAAGWTCSYAAEVVARHLPEPGPDRSGRELLLARNDLLTVGLRRPARRVPATAWRRLRRVPVRSWPVLAGRLAPRLLAVARAREPVPDWLDAWWTATEGRPRRRD